MDLSKNCNHFCLQRCFAFLLIFLMLFSGHGALASSTKGTTTCKVHLRQKASTSSTCLKTLSEGETVTILSSSGSWYKVSYGKTTGYMMKKYVATSSSVKSSTASSSSSSGSSSSVQKKIKALGSAPGTMAVGDCNSDVKKLQKALTYLGYYTGSIDGDYGSGTKKAVKAYQKAKGLTADGVAGKKTVTSIFGSCSSTSKTKSTSSSGSPKVQYKTEVLDWFKDNVSAKIPKGAVFTVKDVKTGLTFQVKRWSGYNHIDAEPLTAKDTAVMKRIYGSWSWRRRPILILVRGHVYAASMNCMPHGTTTISKNNFDGHFCIHFKNSKTHGSKKVDSAHQNCVKTASKYTW